MVNTTGLLFGFGLLLLAVVLVGAFPPGDEVVAAGGGIFVTIRALFSTGARRLSTVAGLGGGAKAGAGALTGKVAAPLLGPATQVGISGSLSFKKLFR